MLAGVHLYPSQYNQILIHVMYSHWNLSYALLCWQFYSIWFISSKVDWREERGKRDRQKERERERKRERERETEREKEREIEDQKPVTVQCSSVLSFVFIYLG